MGAVLVEFFAFPRTGSRQQGSRQQEQAAGAGSSDGESITEIMVAPAGRSAHFLITAVSGEKARSVK
jgi:hypothetical protein